MGEVISIEKNKEEEDSLVLCPICDQDNIISLHFFVYEQKTFKCCICGTDYEYNDKCNT